MRSVPANYISSAWCCGLAYICMYVCTSYTWIHVDGATGCCSCSRWMFEYFQLFRAAHCADFGIDSMQDNTHTHPLKLTHRRRLTHTLEATEGNRKCYCRCASPFHFPFHFHWQKFWYKTKIWFTWARKQYARWEIGVGVVDGYHLPPYTHGCTYVCTYVVCGWATKDISC